MAANTSVPLLGTRELQLILGGVSRQRVYQVTNQAGFPAPVAILGSGRVWSGDDVDAWTMQHPRPTSKLNSAPRTARPPTAATGASEP